MIVGIFVFFMLGVGFSAFSSHIEDGNTIIDSKLVFLSGISFLLMILSGVIFAFGIILTRHYNNLRKDYYRKFTAIPKELLASAICPNCKNALPKDYPDIYIFCGYNPYKPNRKIKSYNKEITKSVNTTLICHNCEKTLPDGNPQFCPYCGKSVKS